MGSGTKLEFGAQATDDGMLQWSLLRLMNTFCFFYASSIILPFFFCIWYLPYTAYSVHPTPNCLNPGYVKWNKGCLFNFAIFDIVFFSSFLHLVCHAKCVLMLHNHTGGTIFILCTRYSPCENQKMFIFIYLRRALFPSLFQFLRTAVPFGKNEYWTLNTFASVFVEFATCQNVFLSFYLGEFMVGPVETVSAYTSVKLKQNNNNFS